MCIDNINMTQICVWIFNDYKHWYFIIRDKLLNKDQDSWYKAEMRRPGLSSKTFCFLPDIVSFYVFSEQNCKSRWNILLMSPTSYIWSPPNLWHLDSWLPGPLQYNPAALAILRASFSSTKFTCPVLCFLGLCSLQCEYDH